jgi:hypothetical protein
MKHETRTTIARAALSLARHVHDGAFAGVIVSGGSHELSQSLLELGWNTQFAGEPLPPISVLPDAANRMLYKHAEQPEPAETGEPERESFAWWLHANIPELEARRRESLCIVDDFALTGHKTLELPRSLELQGFTKLQVAVFAAPHITELDRSVFVATVDDEAVYELQRLSQHISGKPDNQEIMAEVATEAQKLHREAQDEITEIGREMRTKDV